MATSRRSRTLGASPKEVWSVVCDPYHLPRWWPRIERVEDVGRKRWTEVMRTEKGRAVRLDQRLDASEALRLRRWKQELVGSPFERVVAEAVTEVRLEPDGDRTLVTIELRRRLKGTSRLGGFMFKRAGRKQLDEALDGLERACVGDA
jgi:uncharacterized protein YndB with AHSA1/START domain